MSRTRHQHHQHPVQRLLLVFLDRAVFAHRIENFPTDRRSRSTNNKSDTVPYRNVKKKKKSPIFMLFEVIRANHSTSVLVLSPKCVKISSRVGSSNGPRDDAGCVLRGGVLLLRWRLSRMRMRHAVGWRKGGYSCMSKGYVFRF